MDKKVIDKIWKIMAYPLIGYVAAFVFFFLLSGVLYFLFKVSGESVVMAPILAFIGIPVGLYFALRKPREKKKEPDS